MERCHLRHVAVRQARSPVEERPPQRFGLVCFGGRQFLATCRVHLCTIDSCGPGSGVQHSVGRNRPPADRPHPARPGGARDSALTRASQSSSPSERGCPGGVREPDTGVSQNADDDVCRLDVNRQGDGLADTPRTPTKERAADVGTLCIEQNPPCHRDKPGWGRMRETDHNRS
jgi:hypothetical protein